MTDQTAAPRPVPTFADRTATDAPLPTWLPDALEELRAERVKTGRLEGDLRSQTRAIREALAERDEARRLASLTAEQEAANAQIIVDTRAERDAARNDAKQAAQLADFRQGVNDSLRQDLSDAGEVLAVVRDAAERIDRALATYDTAPGGSEPEVDPDEDRAALEKLIATAHTDFAIATTPAERVEVIRDLLDGWYAAWPDTAVTDPHEPIAWELSSLVAPALGSPRRAQEEPVSEEIRWAYRWLDAAGNVLDEMDTRDLSFEKGEERAHRLAANRPPSIPGGAVVRYRVVTTAEVVATYPPEARP